MGRAKASKKWVLFFFSWEDTVEAGGRTNEAALPGLGASGTFPCRQHTEQLREYHIEENLWIVPEAPRYVPDNTPYCTLCADSLNVAMTRIWLTKTPS